MKKILLILVLFTISLNAQVSRNRLKQANYSWISRQVSTNPFLDSTFKSFHNIIDDGAAATATNSMAFTNKSGNISQWTNNSGYLTSANTSTLYLPINNPAYTGSLTTGTPSYTDINIWSMYQGSNNNYYQSIWQNTNSGNQASTDLVVSNNLGTATSFYGNIGMNSSTFTGTSVFNQPNYVYVTSTSADLALGTTSTNAIHLAANSATTDALTVTSSNSVNVPGLFTSNGLAFTARAPTGATWGQVFINSGATVDGPTFWNDNSHFGWSIRNGTKKLSAYVDTTAGNVAAQISTNAGTNLGIFSTGVFGITWGPNGVSLGAANYNPTARAVFATGATSMQPIRMFSGALATGTNIIAGGIEFLTDKWYGTISTGTLQKEFSMNDQALTGTRVPFTVNGRFTDDAGFTYTTTGGLTTAGLNSTAGSTLNALAQNGTVTFADAINVVLGSTTGTKFGTATSQKLGFFNATPVIQQTATTDPIVALSNLGFRATGTAWPLTTTGAISFSNATVSGALTTPQVTNAGALVLNAATGNVLALKVNSVTVISISGGTSMAASIAHIAGLTSVGTATLGTGAGTGATFTLTTCTDAAGTISITTGTTPTASGVVITIPFGAAFTTAPHVSLTPKNAAAASMSGTGSIYPTTSTTQLILNDNSVAPVGSTLLVYDYLLIQ